MVYKALVLCTYGVFVLSIAYQVRMNGVYFASMAYCGVCTAYELRTGCAPCAALALPLRRCCVVEYFSALHEYLLCQHDDRRQKAYEPAHEIMALFDLRKFNLQTRMRSHPVGLDV